MKKAMKKVDKDATALWEKAQRNLKKDGYLAGTFIVLGPRTAIVPVPPWLEPYELFQLLIPRLMDVPGLIALILLTEAWVSAVLPGEFEASVARDELIPPRHDHPDREESLNLILWYPPLTTYTPFGWRLPEPDLSLMRYFHKEGKRVVFDGPAERFDKEVV